MINFSQKQLDFLKKPLIDYNILHGVTASGKSFVSNLKWYDTICSAPKKSLFLQSGRTSETLYNNITTKLLKIDEGIGWIEYKSVEGRKRLIVKPTNTEVICIGADDKDAQERVRGLSVDGWYGDEATIQDPTFIEMADSRCRQEVNGKLVHSPVIWTLNPDNPNNIIKKYYIDRIDEINGINWIFGFQDNPLVDQKFIENIRKQHAGIFAKRMIEGLWVVAEGVIYDNFNPAIHIINSYPKNQIIEWSLGYDWGYDHPLVLLLIGTDSEGINYVVDELYCRHQLIDNSLKTKIDRAGWFNVKLSTAYGSPERPEFIVQLADLLGINCYAADNAVLPGIDEVQKKLIVQDNGKCKLYLLSNCVNLCNEFQTYHWKQSRYGISKDEPEKIDDDGVDALRYNIYSRRINFDFSNERMTAGFKALEVNRLLERSRIAV